MQPIRFATIGTSHIAEVFMDAASQLPEDVEYVACYSRTMEKAREFGEARGARLFFDDLDALAACDEVDAVYIATPNTLHREQAIRMLRAGKHVLLEKPFRPTLAEAREVFEATNGNGDAVVPVSTADYYAGAEGPTAPRPRFSTLDLSRLEAAGFCMPDWVEELAEYLATMDR